MNLAGLAQLTALPRPSRNWLSGIIEIVAKEEKKRWWR